MALWQDLKRNSGLADPNWRRFVLRWSVVSLLLIGVAAYCSYGFFQFDEHYQIVEFAGYKLGKTPQAELAWEYRAQIRPWLQPAIYYAAAKAMTAAGVVNPFVLATGFRAVSGTLGWLAVVSLMLSANVLFGPGRRRRLAVMLLALVWLIPYLAVRTSSEALAGDFFTLGVAALLLGSAAVEPNGAETGRGSVRGRWRFSPAACLVAGICFGLAFEFRFQVAFAVFGVLGWLLYSSGEASRPRFVKFALICAGGLAMVALGSIVDRWGYGQWVFVPWNYFHVDVLQGRPSLDGTQPTWGYFSAMTLNRMAPITLLWTLAMLATWIRFPRHILTWATLPFFVGHSLVPHKELRYMFPLAMLGTFFFVLALVPASDWPRRPAWLTAPWRNRRSWWAKALVGVNLLGLMYACLVAKEPSLNFQHFLYDHYPNGCTLYVLGEKTRSPFENVGATMFFYRAPNFVCKRLRDDNELASVLQHSHGEFLVVRDRLGQWSPPADPPAESRLVYHTYPSWVEGYDYFNWLRNSKRFNLYAINPVPADTVASKPPESAPASVKASAVVGFANSATSLR